MMEDVHSLGRSWYEDSVGQRPIYQALTSEVNVDVAIIGGGFTGLSAAYYLAKNGVSVALCEQGKVGGGASGRNGGQLGTGQRQWVEDLERLYGFERVQALFTLSEQAKSHLMNFAEQNHIEIDYQPGQLSVVHSKRYLDGYRAHIDAMARYGYRQLHFMDAQETKERLGSGRYLGGLCDQGTGHIHPLKLLLGTARAAAAAGAQIYERSCVEAIERQGRHISVQTRQGRVLATKLFLATNGMGGKLEKMSAARVLSIRSFIGATVPLANDLQILPRYESVDDSRFVVRYFRKTADNRLLFGGAEAYGRANQVKEKSVRAQIEEVYPQLRSIKLTHIWGGMVGITVERLPFVREVAPDVVFCGGYSGHGVMLSHYCGRLYAESLLGQNDDLRLMKELKISRFPGGLLRTPLLFLALHWFSLLDRI